MRKPDPALLLDGPNEGARLFGRVRRDDEDGNLFQRGSLQALDLEQLLGHAGHHAPRVNARRTRRPRYSSRVTVFPSVSGREIAGAGGLSEAAESERASASAPGPVSSSLLQLRRPVQDHRHR